ncbi:MAG: sugar ABC transporter ATP-binding protein, partial [Alphaproteobacteria bacterium]|nr:sugar ABC transporter ATP-binding protein [Alphaproteobacteria bacterium]
ALAVREVAHVLDLIRQLKRQGISVVLISHRLTDVFEVSDRIVTLRQGRVIADELVSETAMSRVVAHIVGAA